jgi:hypothetical protein
MRGGRSFTDISIRVADRMADGRRDERVRSTGATSSTRRWPTTSDCGAISRWPRPADLALADEVLSSSSSIVTANQVSAPRHLDVRHVTLSFQGWILVLFS